MGQMRQDLAETIVDAKAYADFDRIHETFTELRKTAPVALAEPEGFEPFWVVTKYQDIRSVERDQDLFHAGDKSTVLTNIAADKETRSMTGGSPHIFRTLVQMDQPDHIAYRKLTADWFSAATLARHEPRIRRRIGNTIARLEESAGECDFAKDIALYYPLHVIMDILGVPPEGEEIMLKLTQQIFGPEDSDMNRMEGKSMSAQERTQMIGAVAQEAFAYFAELTEERRKKPQDDLASVISNGQVNGNPLEHNEAMSYYVITATAGHDTTSNSTSSGIWQLCEKPELLQQLKDNPEQIPAFVEESIRWESPVKHFMRTATRDTELNGVQLAKDDWMMLSFASACRDEEVYTNPFEFDITRQPNRHMAMGFGAHVCLGQHLARLEMRIFWEEMLKRLKHVELAGEPQRVSASFVSGPKSVPIRFSLT